MAVVVVVVPPVVAVMVVLAAVAVAGVALRRVIHGFCCASCGRLSVTVTHAVVAAAVAVAGVLDVATAGAARAGVAQAIINLCLLPAGIHMLRWRLWARRA